MADDYENLETIVETVNSLMSKNGASGITELDAQLEVRELIREGFAKAYILSSTPPYSIVSDYSESSACEFWFMLTPAGIQAMNEQD